jgi:hypothetical protein
MKSILQLTMAELKAMKPRLEIWQYAQACGGDMQLFWDNCPNGEWLLWLLRKTGNLPALKARKIGLAYAKKVLPIFEQHVPFDDGPRLCLQAVEVFIKSPTVANQKAMVIAAQSAHDSCNAYAAAAAAYHAAFYTCDNAASDCAVGFATCAAEIVKSSNTWASTIDTEVRRKFAQWGADKVRAIVKKAPARKSHT